MALIYRETLPNGLRIVGEKMDNYRSVSIGCWVLAGSVCENLAAGESGVSHFIEHMLFKGTESRSAERIAEDIDAIGGNMNAFTSKECTCFYVKVIDENLDAAMELLADLVCNSKLDPADIEREKGVVLEEIAMNEDNPEDLVHENLCTLYYEGERLAQPVLGTEASVSALDRQTIRSYMARRYLPGNIVVSAAGNFDTDALRAAVERSFRFDKIAEGAAKTAVPEPEKIPETNKKQRFLFINKDVEQTHIALAFPGFASEDPGQYPLYMLNNAVGGSMSSRLYQSIRERSGMAYSVYSGPTFFRGSGYFTLYAGTGEKQAEQVLKLMLAEYKKLRDEGVTEAEIARSRRQMKTSFVLGRENTSAHSSALGRSELFNTRFLTDDEILSMIDSVTAESVNAILPRVCDFSAMKAVCVGRLGKTEAGLNDILMNIE